MIARRTWKAIIPNYEKNYREMLQKLATLKGDERNDFRYLIHCEEVNLYNMRLLADGRSPTAEVMSKEEWLGSHVEERDVDIQRRTRSDDGNGDMQREEGRRDRDRRTPRRERVDRQECSPERVGDKGTGSAAPLEAVSTRIAFWNYQVWGPGVKFRTAYEAVRVGRLHWSGKRCMMARKLLP